MNNKCELCESSVRQDLMPIHIKHYHNILQDDTFSKLFSRIEALEKQVEDLTKENANHSVTNSLTVEMSPELSHLELKNLCQNVCKLNSFHFKNVMAMIKGSDSIPNDDKNYVEKQEIEKFIVNLEPCIAISLSNYVNECQSSTLIETKEETQEIEKLINDEDENKEAETIQELEPVQSCPEIEIQEYLKKRPKNISPRKFIRGVSAKKRTCPYCLKKLSHWSIFRHINNVHNSKSNFVTCKLCKKKLGNKNSLYCHMWRVHKGAKAYQ